MRSQTRPADEGGISRRTALGLGLGAVTTLGVTGCALNNPLHEQSTPAARAVRDLEPDVAVAVEAATALRAALTAATATGAQHAGLAARLAGLVAAHQTHLTRVLAAVPHGVDTSAPATTYAVPTTPTAALAQLRASEKALHDALVGLAMRAESGPFARLLGSMAAATSQQLRELGR
ncbi:MAG TPA: hypothetical protein VHO29_10395 [Marmoricola sp.]|nr:hypothetical protein [Marmoricola sp.]